MCKQENVLNNFSGEIWEDDLWRCSSRYLITLINKIVQENCTPTHIRLFLSIFSAFNFLYVRILSPLRGFGWRLNRVNLIWTPLPDVVNTTAVIKVYSAILPFRRTIFAYEKAQGNWDGEGGNMREIMTFFVRAGWWLFFQFYRRDVFPVYG